MLPIIQVSKSKTERETMPQIYDDSKFIVFCRSHGISCRKVAISPDKLKPRQNDINLNKVFSILSEGLDTNRRPLLAAQDFEILDGHHRWYAGIVQRSKVITYHIQASEHVLIRLAFLFGATTKSINVDD